MAGGGWLMVEVGEAVAVGGAAVADGAGRGSGAKEGCAAEVRAHAIVKRTSRQAESPGLIIDTSIQWKNLRTARRQIGGFRKQNWRWTHCRSARSRRLAV